MTEEFLSGTLLDEQQQLTLTELASIACCQSEWIIELVEEGVIVPTGDDPNEWEFSGICLVRVRTALRLHRDLNVNFAGIALALDLLDEIEALQSRLGILEE